MTVAWIPKINRLKADFAIETEKLWQVQNPPMDEPPDIPPPDEVPDDMYAFNWTPKANVNINQYTNPNEWAPPIEPPPISPEDWMKQKKQARMAVNQPTEEGRKLGEQGAEMAFPATFKAARGRASEITEADILFELGNWAFMGVGAPISAGAKVSLHYLTSVLYTAGLIPIVKESWENADVPIWQKVLNTGMLALSAVGGASTFGGTARYLQKAVPQAGRAIGREVAPVAKAIVAAPAMGMVGVGGKVPKKIPAEPVKPVAKPAEVAPKAELTIDQINKEINEGYLGAKSEIRQKRANEIIREALTNNRPISRELEKGLADTEKLLQENAPNLRDFAKGRGVDREAYEKAITEHQNLISEIHQLREDVARVRVAKPAVPAPKAEIPKVPEEVPTKFGVTVPTKPQMTEAEIDALVSGVAKKPVVATEQPPVVPPRVRVVEPPVVPPEKPPSIPPVKPPEPPPVSPAEDSIGELIKYFQSPKYAKARVTERLQKGNEYARRTIEESTIFQDYIAKHPEARDEAYRISKKALSGKYVTSVNQHIDELANSLDTEVKDAFDAFYPVKDVTDVSGRTLRRNVEKAWDNFTNVTKRLPDDPGMKGGSAYKLVMDALLAKRPDLAEAVKQIRKTGKSPKGALKELFVDLKFDESAFPLKPWTHPSDRPMYRPMEPRQPRLGGDTSPITPHDQPRMTDKAYAQAVKDFPSRVATDDISKGATYEQYVKDYEAVRKKYPDYEPPIGKQQYEQLELGEKQGELQFKIQEVLGEKPSNYKPARDLRTPEQRALEHEQLRIELAPSPQTVSPLQGKLNLSAIEAEAIQLMNLAPENEKWADLVHKIFINSLLSGPKTHIVNIGSTAAHVAIAPVDTLIASLIGGRSGRYMGEAAYQVAGAKQGFVDGVRAAMHTAKTGIKPGALAKYDYIPRGKPRGGEIVNRLITIPTTGMEMADQFHYHIARQMELSRLAFVSAKRHGLVGKAFKEEFQNLVRNPNKIMTDAADKFALDRIFRRAPGEATQTLMNLRAKVPGAKFVLPFISTPINLAKVGLERSPLGIANIKMWKNFKKGDPEAINQLAKVIEGSMIAGAFYIYAKDGFITGAVPNDAGKRKKFYDSGKQPYSIKVGTNWVSYQRWEPLNLTLAQVAGVVDAVTDEDMSWQKKALYLGLTIADNITSQTYYSSLTNISDAIEDPEKEGMTLVNRMVGSTVVPYSALMRTIAQSTDEYIRKPTNVLEEIQANIPGLSKNVPIKTYYGKLQERKSPAWSPVNVIPESGGATGGLGLTPGWEKGGGATKPKSSGLGLTPGWEKK